MRLFCVGKPLHMHKADDSLPQLRWLACWRARSATLLFLLIMAGTAEATTDSFVTSGTSIWTAPAGVTSATVEAWGGGGAGGGATGNPAKGGGGAGGQYASKVVTVSPGSSYTVVVGAGGTGSTGNGTAGDDSTFNGTDVVAKGGAGGTGATNGAAGIGTNANGIGDTVYAGGSGAAGAVDNNCNSSGAGGGGAGSGGPGNNALGNTGGLGMATGGGSGGDASNSSGNGSVGSTAGGAGSGACAENNTNRTGGAGARGMVSITYASVPPGVTTNAATSLTASGATLNGTVTSNGGSTTVNFDYGLTTAYGSSAPAIPISLGASASNAAVSTAVTGLACNTTYHFRVNATNSVGTSHGADLTFTTSACPVITSINTTIASPTNAASVSWTATFSASVTGVSSSNFTLVNSGLGGTPAITGVSGSGTTWTVTASTGTGAGTLGLNMANVTGISPDVTPTTFTGQVYTIDRTAPTVSSISLVNPTPTALASVSWTVTFSKSVTGVNAADFALVQAGDVSGAAITSVTGSGTSWTVTASTGTGNGTLGLNLIDDDSIIDSASNPLGGTGVGNGDAIGAVYTITKPSVYYHDTTSGVAIGFDGSTNVTSGTNQNIPPIITALLTSANTCGGSARSANHPAGLYTHSRWYLNTNYTANKDIAANPSGSAFLRGNAATDTVIVSLYDYDPVSGAKTLIGSSSTITLTGGGATTAYPYTISSAIYTMSAGHRLMLEYQFNQPGTTNNARVYCSSANAYISVTETTSAPLNCTSNASSNWGLSTTWTNCRGGIPLAGDQVTILGAHTVTLNTTTPVLGDLTNGGTLNASGTNTLSIGGNFINNGTVSLGSSNVDLYGNFSNTTGASFNLGATDSGTWTFRGTSLQNINSTDTFTTFPKLALNNTLGIALNASATVKTLLTLTAGYISTSNNTLTLSANCTDVTSTNGTSWVRTSGFVNGNLRLKFPTGTTTCTFPVGSVTYAPISVALTASAAGTTLTGSSIGSEHPQIATAGIDATKDVNRYWSLWADGDTATAVTSYGATFTFVAGDLDIGATTSNFIVGKYVGSVWTLPTIGTRTSTSISITGVSGPITAAIAFAAGEAGVVDAPCTSPAGMTCMCDNFARSNLNPSTIYGADWFVGNMNNNTTYTGCTFSDPIIANSGFLRLTSNCSGRATVANVPGTFPAAGNLIVVEFKHYAYSGTGGDGMALTLSDSTKTPTPGAFGGSLGYAQKIGSDCATPGGCPGFNGGWIGVAIDEYGNFSANSEGRTGVATPPPTAPGATIDSVAVRGSGSGLTGYPYLGGSGTLSSSIDNASSTATPGDLYRITVDARCYQSNATGCSNPSLNKVADVKVERDTSGLGTGYVTVVSSFDAFTVNPDQDNVPVNWKLSFTGSTGANHNTHEISGLKICSNSYSPPSGFSILVDNLSPTTCATDSNGKPVITVSAHDSNGNVIANYTNTVTLNARVSSPSGSNSTYAVWSMVAGSANGTLTGNQYTFAAADNGVAKFYLTDTNSEDIYIAISENGGTLSTTLSTPLQYRGTAFTVTTPDTLGTGVVAGRNHLMSITRSSGCGTDTAYSGAKNLDGWYSIATGTHPAGAYAPELCATNVEGGCLPATGSCATLSIAPPALNASSNYLPALTFTGGVANFCLMTTDVGNYSVNLRDDSNVSLPITGSSATLAVRPFAVVASNVKQGAINNPATSNATGTPMVAGSAFQAMVAGYLWNSTGDTYSNGLPGASADYTAITGGGIAHSYADTVVLSPRTPFAPTTPFDTPAGTGIKGDLTNGSVALTGGSATLSTLSYNEVGSFTLKATPSVNYFNAGVDLSARVAYFTNPDSTLSTSWVGRFRPDHFTLTQGTTTSGCGTFTYFGQDGFSSTAFTLTAQNSNNATTQNYAGSYAKLALTTWANFGFTVTSPPAGSVLSASATAPTGSWIDGVATVTAKHQLSRPTALTGETNVMVKAEPVDSDGVTMTAANIAPSTPLRYGRLFLQNAYGSELLALPMSLTAEYWNGTSWVTNAADSCTALTAPADGSGLALNLASTGTTTSTLSNPLVSGDAGFSLAAPGATHTGFVSVVIDSPPWLDFKWDGVHDTDPTARATFGIYKGNSKFIYIRELY